MTLPRDPSLKGSRPLTPEHRAHFEALAAEMVAMRKDNRYKSEYRTWDDCCARRWGLSRERCRVMMKLYGRAT